MQIGIHLDMYLCKLLVGQICLNSVVASYLPRYDTSKQEKNHQSDAFSMQPIRLILSLHS